MRLVFLGAGGEEEVVVASLNNLPRLFPPTDAAFFRWRWCGRGGLLWSRPPVLLRLCCQRSEEDAGLLGQGCRGSCGSIASWRMGRAGGSRGGGSRRRSASVHAGSCLGRGPGRLGVQRWLISVFECLLRLSSKPQGKGAPSSSGMAAAAGFADDGGDRCRRIRSAWSSRRPRDLNAIFCFLEAFLLFGWNSCPLYPYTMYLYLYFSLTSNTGMFVKKKRSVGLQSRWEEIKDDTWRKLRILLLFCCWRERGWVG